MKRPLVFVCLSLLIATLACTVNISVPTMQIGDKKTYTINEPVPANATLSAINLTMGAGSLTIKGNSDALISGTIIYNVPKWDPQVSTTDSGVSIVQGEETDISGVPSSSLINNWSVQLNNTIPIDLTLSAGAYKGTMDFTGIHLHSLSVTDGASQNKVTFSDPNPEKMESLTYRTGASKIDLLDLANANCATMDFEGGAGSYTFDFSGTLAQDMDVTLRTGVSSITIKVPADITVNFVNSSGVSHVTTSGTWTVNGDNYSTGTSGHILSIHAETAVSSITLVKE